MAKRSEKILTLDAKVCRLGKISNNLERHADDYVTAFTIPVAGLMLTKAELNKFMRDKYCYQSWFDTTQPGAGSPMSWWGDEHFHLSQSFEADELTILVSGDRPLTFEAELKSNGDDDDDGNGEETKRAACEITKIMLRPQYGGLTELRFHLSLRPGIGKANLQLQEHQHREVKLTLIGGRVKAKNDRQPQLPMGAPAESAPETVPGPLDETAATH
jgi:hypothetical protein